MSDRLALREALASKKPPIEVGDPLGTPHTNVVNSGQKDMFLLPGIDKVKTK